MVPAWPNTLVAEIAERRCIIVMGAGASMGCVGADGKSRPPGWESLMRELIKLIQKPADRKFATQLLKERQYLNAAEIIADCANPADLGRVLRSALKTPRFERSEMHKLILDIDPKIVVTTNYDEIYDGYCTQGLAKDGYNICRYYEDHAIDNIRSTIRLIVKAHGCVSDPSRIVLSRSSYFRARRDHSSFYEILDALFLTHTLLFVGCSLTDPDIQLVLENANIAAPSTHPHYALVEKRRHQSIIGAIKRTYNMQLLEYEVGRHDLALDALRELKDEVLDYRRVHTS